MKKTLEKMAWAFAGSAITLGVALTYGVAIGQQAPGAPGGPGGPGGGFRGMVMGTVVQKDLTNNAVQVNTQQGQRWVQFAKDATVTKVEAVALDEVKQGETISVDGTPTDMVAANVEALGEVAAAAPDAQTTPGQPQQEATARVTGTVAGLNPLVVQGPGDAKVTVVTNEKTKVARRKQVGVKDITDGDSFFAFGQPDQRDVVQARFGATGEADLLQAMMQRRMGGRRMGGGRPGGGPGGPGGAGGFPPQQ